jgi:hypothetical protein
MDDATGRLAVAVRAVEDPGLPAVLDGELQPFDQLGLRGIVAEPGAGQVEGGREAPDVVQGPRAERGPDLLERVPGGLRERGARERLEQPTAEVQGDRLVEGEGERGLVAPRPDAPGLAAEFADGLLERESDAPEEVEVAADRALGDVQLAGHLADRQAETTRGEGPEQGPLASQAVLIAHVRMT